MKPPEPRGIPESVRIVFFDYGDTLAYMSPAPLEVWTLLGKELGLQIDPDPLQRAMNQADAHLARQLAAYRGRMSEYWMRYDALILKNLGIADPKAELCAAFHKGFNRPDWYHAYPETHEVLRSLTERGYSLGIISNNVDDIMQRLEQLDLLQYFETITYSQEAGAEKPDPNIFRVALQRASRTPQEAIHVGDAYEADVSGALGVGIIPVLIDRHNRYPEANCWRIASLLELVARGEILQGI
jgi:putative hydrolase of the HAD superfamily